VEADFFDKTLNIYPSRKVEKGIKAIMNGDDLKHVRTQDGKPVLERSYDMATLDGVAGNLTLIVDAGRQFGKTPESEAHTFVVVDDKGNKHDGSLDLTSVPNFALGMKVENGRWQAFDVSPMHGSLHTVAAFGFL